MGCIQTFPLGKWENALERLDRIFIKKIVAFCTNFVMYFLEITSNICVKMSNLYEDANKMMEIMSISLKSPIILFSDNFLIYFSNLSWITSYQNIILNYKSFTRSMLVHLVSIVFGSLKIPDTLAILCKFRFAFTQAMYQNRYRAMIPYAWIIARTCWLCNITSIKWVYGNAISSVKIIFAKISHPITHKVIDVQA